MPRYINDIIIHSTATPEGRDHCAADIKAWHIQRGFRTIGYHYVIRLDGSIERGRPISQAGAHCYGHNAHSIGIVYVGGTDREGNPKDTRTAAQRASMLRLVTKLIRMYRCKVHGHRDYAATACPSFDVDKEYGGIFDQIFHY